MWAGQLLIIGFWGLCVGVIAWCIVLMRKYLEFPTVQTALVAIAIIVLCVLLASLVFAVCIFGCEEVNSAFFRWVAFLAGIGAGVGVISGPDWAIRWLIRRFATVRTRDG